MYEKATSLTKTVTDPIIDYIMRKIKTIKDATLFAMILFSIMMFHFLLAIIAQKYSPDVDLEKFMHD